VDGLAPPHAVLWGQAGEHPISRGYLHLEMMCGYPVAMGPVKHLQVNRDYGRIDEKKEARRLGLTVELYIW
jgi:hypothetical protein